MRTDEPLDAEQAVGEEVSGRHDSQRRCECREASKGALSGERAASRVLTSSVLRPASTDPTPDPTVRDGPPSTTLRTMRAIGLRRRCMADEETQRHPRFSSYSDSNRNLHLSLPSLLASRPPGRSACPAVDSSTRLPSIRRPQRCPTELHSLRIPLPAFPHDQPTTTEHARQSRRCRACSPRDYSRGGAASVHARHHPWVASPGEWNLLSRTPHLRCSAGLRQHAWGNGRKADDAVHGFSAKRRTSSSSTRAARARSPSSSFPLRKFPTRSALARPP